MEVEVGVEVADLLGSPPSHCMASPCVAATLDPKPWANQGARDPLLLQALPRRRRTSSTCHRT